MRTKQEHNKYDKEELTLQPDRLGHCKEEKSEEKPEK
jgi:hypothetical protein